MAVVSVSRARAFLVNCCLLVGTFGLTLGIAEVALRMTAGPDRWSVWPPNLRVTLHPSAELLPGLHGPSTFSTNSWGLRGGAVPSSPTYTILAIGGSTTECLYLDDSRTWPQLLQQLLNEGGRPGTRVWIGNAGKSGLNSRHNVVQVARLLSQFPSVDAILLLVGINDVSYRLAADTTYSPNWRSSPTLERIVGEAFAARPGSDSALPRYKRTELWRRMRLLRQRLLPEPAEDPIQDLSGTFYARMRELRNAASRLRDSLPDLTTSLAEYRRNLLEIVGTAQRYGTRVILATQPTLWDQSMSARAASLLWFGGVGKFQVTRGSEYYTVPAMIRAMRQYNDELLSVCNEAAVECIDLAAQIPKDTTMFYDDVHFNDGGARRVAEILASYFLARPPFRGALR